MAKKELGYVEMEWVCPRCGSKNPGPQKTCTTCGGPQPQDVHFQQREGQSLIQGAEAEKISGNAPDVHCAYCGTRNKADALVCIQCGADLKDAQRRESGEVVGAYSSGSVPDRPCPNCGQLNPAGAQRCSNCGAALTGSPPQSESPAVPPVQPRPPLKLSPVMLILGIVGVIGILILCVVIATSLGRTESIRGSVQSAAWMTRLPIEQYQQVDKQDWENNIPAAASVGACEYRYAFTSSEPQPVSTEVCGTPYTVDQGTGFGQVVQDCSYETYARYCDYTISQWVMVDELTLQGSDLFPQLPNTFLSNDQRAGDASATYTIQFLTDQGVLPFTTSDLSLFQLAKPGSRWSLEINRSGKIVNAQPES